MIRLSTLLCRLSPALLVAGLYAGQAAAFPDHLFGYREVRQADIAEFPQWVSVLERHFRDDLRDGDCGEHRLNRCHMARWLAFLRRIRGLSRAEQLRAVNQFANSRDYVLDIENYGLEDYWAIPRQFLYNGGDCEDYAITKLFSLRWLGFPPGDMRIVVLQDTNLRVPHAVLALSSNGQVLILDNQVEQVLPQTAIVHYTPVYSINEQHWWLHLPDE